jgi:hypothetical protein
MPDRLITVVEMPGFMRDAVKLLGADGLSALTIFLAANPLAGVVVPDTGGFRKVRWATPGGGKRGGSRVVYFFYDVGNPIVLAAIYGKNEKADLSSAEKKDLKALARDFKIRFRRE